MPSDSCGVRWPGTPAPAPSVPRDPVVDLLVRMAGFGDRPVLGEEERPSVYTSAAAADMPGWIRPTPNQRSVAWACQPTGADGCGFRSCRRRAFSACRGAAVAQEDSAGDASQWVMPNANYAGWNYSPLDQIDVDNVEQLTMAWTMQLGVHDSYEASPLVIGDTMYIVTPEPNYVYALDLARDGFIKWEFRPEIPDSELARRSACCGAQTRGLGYADGRIYFATLDGQVFALDAETGEQIWQAENATVAIGETVPGMPLVVGDKVIVGVAGGERGVRGHVTAYNIDDGRFRWRYYSMGPNNEVGIGSRFAPFYPDDRIPNPALDTWSGDSWRRGGARRLGLVHGRPGAESLLLRHEQLRPLESGLPPGVGRGRAGRGRGPDRLPEQLLRVDPGPRCRHGRPDLGLQHDPSGSVGPGRAQREHPRRPRDRRRDAQGAGPPGEERLLLRVRSRDGRDAPRALDVRLQRPHPGA